MEASADKILRTQLNSYIGGPRSALPTPSCCISLPVFEHNVKHFHDALSSLGDGFTFRAHCKTHKTTEGVKLMLENGKYKSVIVSTLREIRGLEQLVKEGVVEDILYGLPPAASYIAQLSTLSAKLSTLNPSSYISLLVDNEAQIRNLRTHPPANGSGSWPVFVKLDVGSSRAGLPIPSSELDSFLKAVSEANGKGIRMRGFYIHAGHSYSGKTHDDATSYLKVETDAGVLAVQKWKKISTISGDIGMHDMTVSIGATPTAHVVSDIPSQCFKLLSEAGADQSWKFEIHAGNFPCNDLQQLSTSVLPPSYKSHNPLALTLNAEVISIYPHRNEALINAGTLAIGREPGQSPGYARIRGKEQWVVGRISQEHGIITLASDQEHKVEEELKVGDNVVLDIQHACIAAAGHDWFFILDEDEVVRDIWWPWRGWH